MAAWYTSSVGWTAVTAWAANTAYSVGDLRRQLAAPAVGSERVFRCTTAGTSHLTTEPTWTLTKGGTTNDNTAVWTEVTGNSTYNWNAPHARLANAIAWAAAGDTIYVGHNHAETQASAMTLSGSSAAPFLVICVNAAGTVPPVSADLATTATITTTGNFGITISSAIFFRGITLNAGSGAVAATITLSGTAGSGLYFKNCALKKNGTSATTAAILLGFTATSPSNVVFDNTTFTFGATGDGIATRRTNSVLWKNSPSAIGGATLPTTLFTAAVAEPVVWRLEGVDLSALASGKTLVAAIDVPQRFYLKDCKLGASVAVSAAQASPGSAEVYLTNCDSAGTNYRHEKYTSAGTQIVETTIVRTGGASIKATPLSWKIATSSTSTWLFPFECLPIVIPDNDVIGTPITIVVQGIWGGAAVPNNDEIWMDAEYFGASNSPQGSFLSTGKADILAAGVALSSGSGTWGGSTVKFQMSVTITPQIEGPIYLYVKAAKASSTFYIDPLPQVS